MCYEKITKQTIGKSLIDSWEHMSHFLNGYRDILWYNCSYIWWCSKSNLFHHSDDIWQRLKKVFVLWIIIANYRSKLNRVASIMIARYPYRLLNKLYFYYWNLCKNLKHILGWYENHQITVDNKLRGMKLHFIVKYGGLWMPLSCIGDLWKKLP